MPQAKKIERFQPKIVVKGPLSGGLVELQPPDRGYFWKFLSPSQLGIFLKRFPEIYAPPNQRRDRRESGHVVSYPSTWVN